jgi:hypothetical protein
MTCSSKSKIVFSRNTSAIPDVRHSSSPQHSNRLSYHKLVNWRARQWGFVGVIENSRQIVAQYKFGAVHRRTEYWLLHHKGLFLSANSAVTRELPSLSNLIQRDRNAEMKISVTLSI